MSQLTSVPKLSRYPNGFSNGVEVRGVPVLNTHAGLVFWVDSGIGSNGNKGTTPGQAFATIDYAIGRCTASNGDLIMVSPGHAETLTATITIDVAGVSIIGLGSGDDRPTLTINAAIDGVTWTADDGLMKNIRFAASSDTATSHINITGDNNVVEGCEVTSGASDTTASVIIGLGVDGTVIAGNEFYVSANGPEKCIDVGGTAVKTKILGNFFSGGSTVNSWGTGVIYSSGVHTECLVEGNNLLFMSGGIGGIQFVAAATGLLRGNFLGGGTLGQMLDPGSCYCHDNWEADAVDEKAREYPTSAAS